MRAFPSNQKHLALKTLGAALYLAGRFEDVILRLTERNKASNEAEGPPRRPFLAMAHHRLGRRDEARRWLKRSRGHRPSGNPNQFCGKSEIHLLHSEAVVLYDPVFPADPFVH